MSSALTWMDVGIQTELTQAHAAIQASGGGESWSISLVADGRR